MDKQKLISAIYKILLLFEDIKKVDSAVTESDYLKYINRVYVRFLGQDKEEIYSSLRGLYFLGGEATHEQVKSIVFHLIELVKKEQQNV